MPRPQARRESKRLNLVISHDLHSKVESVQESIGADSVTEVLRRSLAVYFKLLEEESAGAEIVVRRRGKEKVLFLA